MSESPDASPSTQSIPRSVLITDANAFTMPAKCVVCGNDASTCLSYTQDHLPFIFPGVALVRSTQVSLPYCDNHSQAFHRRFRNLRIAQNAVYAVLFLCCFTIFFPAVRQMLGWGSRPGVGSGIFGGILFLFLVATIFCIKPFLYDAFFSRSGNSLRITSRSKSFIQNVIDSNQAIVR